MEASRTYLISIIVPIYNAARYIGETIDSVVMQTIGFDENIQLILINDGSTDDSEAICLSYADKHPDNIIYRYKENGGVSSARNLGMIYIKGVYANFLDADDTWANDALEKAIDLFENNAGGIDMVACRIKYFERKTGYHVLDGRFAADRIIDLTKEYWAINTIMGNVIFLSDTIRGKAFNEDLSLNEDGLFFAELLIRKPRYGVVRTGEYNYRIRNDETALTSKKNDVRVHFEQLQIFLDALTALSADISDVMPKFIQYTTARFVLWFIKIHNTGIPLSKEEITAYTGYLSSVLANVHIETTIGKKMNTSIAYKKYLYQLKYGRNIFMEADIKDGKMYFDGAKIFDISANKRILWTAVRTVSKSFELVGETDLLLLGDDITVYALDVDKSKKYTSEFILDSNNDRYVFTGEKVMDGAKISLRIPSKNGIMISIASTYRAHDVPMKNRYEMFTEKISSKGHRFLSVGDVIIKKQKRSIALYHSNLLGRILFERSFRRKQ